MKTMRKLFALILALTMVFAMASVVSAAAMTDTGTLTIKNATAGTTYTLYRVLDIEKNPDGTKENVYILNDKWDEFITAEAAKPGAEFTLSGNYVKSMDLSAANAQGFAEAVLAYAQANGIAHDGQSKMTISGDYTSSTPRQYGYYVMVTDRAGTGVKYTVFCLDKSTLTVEEKNVSVAGITKYVQEDSKAGNADGGWGKQNAAEIGQPVSFKIIVDLAPGTETYTITDSMPDFEKIENLSIEYSGGPVTEGTDYTITKTDVVGGNDNGFTITLSDNFRKLVEEGNKLTITYTAKLQSAATIAGTGNINTVTLTAGSVTKTDSTTTYTYEVDVTKVNEKDEPLAGVSFSVKDHNGNTMKFDNPTADNHYVVNPEGTVTELLTNTDGKFCICGVDTEDKYTLVENVAPDGYVKMEDLEIIVSANEAHTQKVKVVNLPGVTMPETGGMGTTLFYVLGGILVCAAAVLLVTKKRMGTAK